MKEYGIDINNPNHCFLGFNSHKIADREYKILAPITDEDPVFSRKKVYFVQDLSKKRVGPEVFCLEVLMLEGEIPKIERQKILVAFGNPTARQKLDLSMILKI